MKKFRIYLDTSVISMRDNPDLGVITREFFDFAKQSGCQFVISEVVEQEIKKIPTEEKREEIFKFLKALNCDFLSYNQESRDLALTYVSDGVLTSNHIDDLTHVAYATVSKCDIIVSWNRRHIANAAKIQKLNASNLKNNYLMIAIYTPATFLTLYK